MRATVNQGHPSDAGSVASIWVTSIRSSPVQRFDMDGTSHFACSDSGERLAFRKRRYGVIGGFNEFIPKQTMTQTVDVCLKAIDRLDDLDDISAVPLWQVDLRPVLLCKGHVERN